MMSDSQRLLLVFVGFQHVLLRACALERVCISWASMFAVPAERVLLSGCACHVAGLCAVLSVCSLAGVEFVCQACAEGVLLSGCACYLAGMHARLSIAR